ncbi:RHS repeat domain-containing protein [Planctomicrobium sp. SH664]|uniref:RHS repeat domain-containing protein n=1 Tax=Planctomicrobium sp. SH664 TaxID=3448125 RepID=UPI003F5C1B6A
MGNRTSTVYDAAGQSIAQINELNKRYSLTYDLAEQQIQQIDPLNRRITSTYNADGNLQTRRDARGNLTTYVYDAGHRVTQRQYPDGSRSTFVYNALGARTVMANATGRYTTTYDELNRKRSVTQPSGAILTYSYQAAGQRRQLQAAGAGVFTYSYDANQQLTVVRNPQNGRTSFAYDNASRRTLKQLANGTRATYSYDAASQLTGISNRKSTGDTISGFSYQYDKAGNRTQILTASGTVTTWSYDRTYRLTEEHRTGTATEPGWAPFTADQWDAFTADQWNLFGIDGSSPGSFRNTFTYDAAGNRLVKNANGARTTSTFDAANQTISSIDGTGTTTYTFDADGNQTVVLKPSGERTTTTWDYENKSTLIQLPSGLRNTMAYDPDGLRVRLDDSTGTKKFIYDGQAYLLETDAGNVLQCAYTQEPATYGNLLSEYRLAGGIWTPRWYQQDVLGSTTELTDVGQNITDTFEYDAWGDVLVRTGNTPTPFEWIGGVGYYKDPDTGIYYVRARIYQPTIGRWWSVDPLGFVDGMNLYAGHFVPQWIDPTGLAPWDHHWFPQNPRQLEKLRKLCGWSNAQEVQDFVNQFTTRYDPGWGIGSEHHTVHHKLGGGTYIDQVDAIYDNAPDCCSALKGIRSLIYQATSELKMRPGNIGPVPFPHIGPYRGDHTGPSNLDFLNNVINNMCAPPPPPQPQPQPQPQPHFRPIGAPPSRESIAAACGVGVGVITIAGIAACSDLTLPFGDMAGACIIVGAIAISQPGSTTYWDGPNFF